MSEEWKIRLKNAVAYALAAAFVWWPLFMAIHPLHQIPAAQAAHSAQSEPYLDRPEPDGFWSIKIGDVLTLCILAVQAVIFFAQAYFAKSQRTVMNDQLAVAALAANAAKTSADAALASLSRPWLAVDYLKNTRIKWGMGLGDLTAEFRISNCGDTPAFLGSVKAFLFLSYVPPNTPPFSGAGLPQTIRPFPSEGELSWFISRFGKYPYRMVNSEIRFQEMLTDNVSAPQYEMARFDSISLLASGGQTDIFMVRERPLASVCDEKIPDEADADVILMVRVVYSGPTIEAEILTLCYKANRFGGFETYGRAPYNERIKADTARD